MNRIVILFATLLTTTVLAINEPLPIDHPIPWLMHYFDANNDKKNIEFIHNNNEVINILLQAGSLFRLEQTNDQKIALDMWRPGLNNIKPWIDLQPSGRYFGLNKNEIDVLNNAKAKLTTAYKKLIDEIVTNDYMPLTNETKPLKKLIDEYQQLDKTGQSIRSLLVPLTTPSGPLTFNKNQLIKDTKSNSYFDKITGLDDNFIKAIQDCDEFNENELTIYKNLMAIKNDTELVIADAKINNMYSIKKIDKELVTLTEYIDTYSGLLNKYPDDTNFKEKLEKAKIEKGKFKRERGWLSAPFKDPVLWQQILKYFVKIGPTFLSDKENRTILNEAFRDFMTIFDSGSVKEQVGQETLENLKPLKKLVEQHMQYKIPINFWLVTEKYAALQSMANAILLPHHKYAFLRIRMEKLKDIENLANKLAKDNTKDREIAILKAISDTAVRKISYLLKIIVAQTAASKRAFHLPDEQHGYSTRTMLDKYLKTTIDPFYRSGYLFYQWANTVEHEALPGLTPNYLLWLEDKDLYNVKSDQRYLIPKKDKRVTISNDGRCYTTIFTQKIIDKNIDSQDANLVADGTYLYAIGNDKNLYILPGERDKNFKSNDEMVDYLINKYNLKDYDIKKMGMTHDMILGGKNVICAGTITFKQGKIIFISTDSGHFVPGSHNLKNAITILKSQYDPFTKDTKIGHYVRLSFTIAPLDEFLSNY